MALDLTAVPPLTAALPKVREDQRVLDRLARQARAAGVSTSEAVRQILADYVRRPYKLGAAATGNLSGALAPIRVDAALLEGVVALAAREGVSVGELIRRVVRRQMAR